MSMRKLLQLACALLTCNAMAVIERTPYGFSVNNGTKSIVVTRGISVTGDHPISNLTFNFPVGTGAVNLNPMLNTYRTSGGDLYTATATGTDIDSAGTNNGILKALFNASGSPTITTGFQQCTFDFTNTYISHSASYCKTGGVACALKVWESVSGSCPAPQYLPGSSFTSVTTTSNGSHVICVYASESQSGSPPVFGALQSVSQAQANVTQAQSGFVTTCTLDSYSNNS